MLSCKPGEWEGMVAPPAVRRLLKWALAPGGCGRVASLEDGARAWFAAAAMAAAKGPLVAVAESARALEQLADDLEALGVPEAQRTVLPPVRAESSRLASGRISPEAEGARLRALQRCLKGKDRGLVATFIQALLEPVLPPDARSRRRYPD